MLYIDDAIITTDAMSCKKSIAEKIISHNADYAIGLKANRKYYLSADVDNYPKIAEWCGLRAIGKVILKTEKGEEIRYFITSLTYINEFSKAVRKHWAIENNLHWSLDIIFREDSSRSKKIILR